MLPRFSPKSSPIRLALCAFFISIGLARAQGPDVRVELTGNRVVVADGKETFVKADKASPGDVIQYKAVYKNVGTAAAVNVAATVPIPAGMQLLPDTAKPPAAEATLDGKNFSPVPLMREVKNESGVTEKQPVPLKEYRALRWKLPELAPGKDATFVLRAQLLSTATENDSPPKQ